MRRLAPAAALLFTLAPPAFAQLPGPPPNPATAYRGGTGAPFSPNASNIGPADTRSDIAPRLPDPDAEGDGPRALLLAAQRALDAHRTGAAQEALERAETRLLSRATDPALAGRPDNARLVRGIGAARRALGAGDIPRARQIVADLLRAPR